jgi:hypothetical protein
MPKPSHPMKATSAAILALIFTSLSTNADWTSCTVTRVLNEHQIVVQTSKAIGHPPSFLLLLTSWHGWGVFRPFILQDLMLKAQIAPDGEKVFYLKAPFSDVRFRVPLDRVEVWVDPSGSS